MCSATSIIEKSIIANEETYTCDGQRTLENDSRFISFFVGYFYICRSKRVKQNHCPSCIYTSDFLCQCQWEFKPWEMKTQVWSGCEYKLWTHPQLQHRNCSTILRNNPHQHCTHLQSAASKNKKTQQFNNLFHMEIVPFSLLVIIFSSALAF